MLGDMIRFDVGGEGSLKNLLLSSASHKNCSVSVLRAQVKQNNLKCFPIFPMVYLWVYCEVNHNKFSGACALQIGQQKLKMKDAPLQTIRRFAFQDKRFYTSM